MREIGNSAENGYMTEFRKNIKLINNIRIKSVKM